jgi:hypothetical protein
VVADTADLIGLFLGTAQGRQQHRRQDRYDGDDNQEFDQGESLAGNIFFDPTLPRHGSIIADAPKNLKLFMRVYFHQNISIGSGIYAWPIKP